MLCCQNAIPFCGGKHTAEIGTNTFQKHYLSLSNFVKNSCDGHDLCFNILLLT